MHNLICFNYTRKNIITTVKITKKLSSIKFSQVPGVIPPSSLLPPNYPISLQSLICFLSLQITFHFLEFHIHGIMQYVLLFFPSDFFPQYNYSIHVICFSELFLLIMNLIPLHGYSTICLSIHLLKDVLSVSVFRQE